jgi:hypothetical protein
MTLWHWLALLSSLIFVCPNFAERNTPKTTCGPDASQAQVIGWSLAVSSGLSCCCWFVLDILLAGRTTDKEDWNCPKEELLSWAVVAHAFYHSTWEAEAGRFLSSRPAWLTVSSRIARAIQRNPVLRNQEEKKSVYQYDTALHLFFVIWLFLCQFIELLKL